MSDKRARFLKPSESASYLDKDDCSLVETTDFVYNRFTSLSLEAQRQRLPIFNYRNHILYLLENYQTLVLVGETGCGKSTQIPQYTIEAEWPGTIGVVEPRRVAAISLASRIADETGTLVQGSTVGYAVRWDACEEQPKIKYMTEGILLREMMADPLLNTYSTIMMDEVHERTLYTDILLGLLKKILRKRKSLRLIIASATMNAEQFRDFFNNINPNNKQNQPKDSAVIMSVEGRVYPVDIYYVKEPVADYVQATIDTIIKINEKNSNKSGRSAEWDGDVLAFLTGQDEVERAVRLLNDYNNRELGDSKHMLVLPMYGSLPYNEQLKVFRPAQKGQRKVVIATNIAETSVTIPGITYVIDCGFMKLRWFNSETHNDNLVVVPISKAAATQRAGRAGRVRNGQTYRLYREEDYEQLSETTPPEIQRTNLAGVVLQLKALGIDNVLRFSFLSPPPARNLLSALELLYALHAIDSSGSLTPYHGTTMAEFALDPLHTRILLASGDYGCADQVLSIIAMLQVENVFVKPASGQAAIRARVQKRNFETEQGDLITLLNVYTNFVNVAPNHAKDYCHQNFVNYKAMKRVVEIRKHIGRLMEKYCVPMLSSRDVDAICKCLTAGLFPNAAYLHHTGVYKMIRGDIDLYIHPDSLFYTVEQPQWVVYSEILHTNKTYMRNITVIQSEWLLEVAPHFYEKTNFLTDTSSK